MEDKKDTTPLIILIKTNSFGDIQLSVCGSTSVWDVKVKLQDKLGIPTSRQQLRLVPNDDATPYGDAKASDYLGNINTLEYFGIGVMSQRSSKPPILTLEENLNPLIANQPASSREDSYYSVGIEPMPRSATEFLTEPTNNLFEVDDILAIVLSFVNSGTKLNGCRLVNHRFKALLPGPAPYISQIPPIEQTNGTGCFGCFEPKVLACSGGEEHVVMAGPFNWSELVCWIVGFLMCFLSIAGSTVFVTTSKTWAALEILVMLFLFGILLSGIYLTGIGFPWRRFVVNYRTRKVTMSSPCAMLLCGFGLCCCRDQAPLSQFKGFDKKRIAGWSWDGPDPASMKGCRELSRQIFDPHRGFFPKPAWKMV